MGEQEDDAPSSSHAAAWRDVQSVLEPHMRHGGQSGRGGMHLGSPHGEAGKRPLSNAVKVHRLWSIASQDGHQLAALWVGPLRLLRAGTTLCSVYTASCCQIPRRACKGGPDLTHSRRSPPSRQLSLRFMPPCPSPKNSHTAAPTSVVCAMTLYRVA